ncbi:hypothetical protein PQX77_017885 [Marasmius sp. AFHP31]|nr:hypothetical protein PQX77_017885 [Marasmius sp. AFHP31]
MNLVWAFDFRPAKDANDKDIPPDVNNYEKARFRARHSHSDGLLPGPKPFNCIITPRHPKVAEIATREFREFIDTFLKFEKNLAPEDQQFVIEQRKELRE